MISNLLKIGYYLLISGLVLIAFIIAASIFPITGNFQLLVVQSGSMEPAIKTGGLVIVKPVSEYNVGDAITFVSGGRKATPITHRIYAVRADGSFTTKGDANEDSDPNAVAKRDVIGKVLFSVPYFGYIVDFAKKPLGFMFIIGIPATIIVGDEIRKIIVEIQRMMREKKEHSQFNEKS